MRNREGPEEVHVAEAVSLDLVEAAAEVASLDLAKAAARAQRRVIPADRAVVEIPALPDQTLILNPAARIFPPEVQGLQASEIHLRDPE